MEEEMRDIPLIKLHWVAEIQYDQHADSSLSIAGKDCPDILSALARVINHAQNSGKYEIISLKQQKYKVR